ncbi:MAG: hypothetical protein WC130_04905 [Kiritimatiellia bacterium]
MIINISSDLERLTKDLDDLARSQIPFAASLALNKTAAFGKANAREEMSRVFDNPRPYTLNAVFVKPSSKRDLTAVVGLLSGKGQRQGAAEYLEAEITGGGRKSTPFERSLAEAIHATGEMIPGKDAKLDSYGNLTKAMRKAIIEAQKKPDGADPRGIFIVPVGAKSHLRPGIYQRMPNRVVTKKRRGTVVSIKGGGTRLKVLMFFDAATSYAPIFNFGAQVERAVRQHFAQQFELAMIRARFSARPKVGD